MKYSRGLDTTLFSQAAEEIEAEALSNGGNDYRLSYVWLRQNGEKISKRSHPFQPGYLERGFALLFVTENLYFHISTSDIDVELVEELSEDFRREALSRSEGALDEAIAWLDELLREFVKTGVGTHTDWYERGRAIGAAHKKLTLEAMAASRDAAGDVREPSIPPKSAVASASAREGTIRERIMEVIYDEPGLSDRDLTNRIADSQTPQQYTNQVCRDFARKGLIERRTREDGLLGNFPLKLAGDGGDEPNLDSIGTDDVELSEDDVKSLIVGWLEKDGWHATVAWGRQHGVDIEATKLKSRWLIEAKGTGSSNPMRVNFFLGAIGEIIQRMDDDNAEYSIAFPNISQFRNLWARLPRQAKARTMLTVIFVNPDGTVEQAD